VCVSVCVSLCVRMCECECGRGGEREYACMCVCVCVFNVECQATIDISLNGWINGSMGSLQCAVQLASAVYIKMLKGREPLLKGKTPYH
jgi:hypothetical protein